MRILLRTVALDIKRRKPSGLQVFFNLHQTKSPSQCEGLFKRPEGFARTGEAKAADRGQRPTRRTYKKIKPNLKSWASLKKGGDILSHRIAVPSAQAGLTSLFEMGRGEPRRNNHLKSVLQG